MIQPRDYQSSCVESIWNNFHKKADQLIVLPTASGKTIIFTLLLKKCLEKFPALKAQVLVNQVKLVSQTQEKLNLAIDKTKTSLFCGSLGEYNDTANVTVASVQSIARKTCELNLLIIDEAHNAENSATYRNYIRRCKETNPKLKIVRFTATPFTTNGYIYGPGCGNNRVDFKRSMQQMIDENYIVEPTFKSSKEKFDVSKLRTKKGEYILKDLEELTKDEAKTKSQVKDALERLKNRKKVVWACTSIKHAEMVKKFVSEYEHCAIIHSKLKKPEQLHNLTIFEHGACRHISSVTMVSEGYDFPAIDAIVCLRPTRSPVLYVQLVGRGLRLSPNKENCLFLDYGEIVENLGHPNDPVVLKSHKKKDQEKKAVICPNCEEINFLPVKKCRDCGYEFFKLPTSPRNMLKNLRENAEEHEFNKNNKKEFEAQVLSCVINENYTSKAGNVCWQVTYSTMQGMIKEWFKIDTYYHKEFKRDFNLMGKPKRILVEKDGKYLKVKERYWS